MLKYQESDNDFSSAIELFKKTYFLDKNFFELESDIHFEIAKSRIKRINVLEFFINKDIIQKTELIELRSKIISDLSKAIDLARSKDSKIWKFRVKYHDIHLERANQYLATNEYESAIKDLNDAMEFGNDRYKDAYYWKLLATSFFELNNKEKSILYCNKLSKNAKDTNTLEFTANLRKQINDFEGAIEDYSKASEIKGQTVTNGTDFSFIENKNKGVYLVERGKLKEEIGLENDAYADYLKAYELDNSIGTKYKELFENEKFRNYLQTNFYKWVNLGINESSS